MRESCSCGAAIAVIGYRKALIWRETHIHNVSDQDVQEVFSDTSFPIGFQPEEEDQ